MDTSPLLWTNLWELIKALLTAGAAYGAVYYGQRRLAMVDERKAEKDLTYLATIVSSDLERFLMECVHVAWDDGVDHRGGGSNNGYFVPMSATPVFDPSKMTVNWHVLPRDLMYDVLAIPARQAGIEAYIGSFDDGPGDDDMVNERAYQYALLGQMVTQIAKQLRAVGKIPDEVLTKGDWSRDEGFQNKVTEYLARKAKHAEIHRLQMEKYPFPVVAPPAP